MIPGELARASDVNDNFAYIMSILGESSTPGRVISPSEFVFGARSNMSLVGSHDTGPTEQEFLQLGWNVDYTFSGGVWKAVRFLTGKAGTAVRIGPSEFSVWSTAAITGSEIGLTKVFSVRTTDSAGSGWTYLPSGQHIQNYDGQARLINDFRMTTVMFHDPLLIYNGIPIGERHSASFNLVPWGFPANAQCAIINIHADNGPNVNRLWVYPSDNALGSVFMGLAPNTPGGLYAPVRMGKSGPMHITIDIDRPLQAIWLHLMGYTI